METNLTRRTDLGALAFVNVSAAFFCPQYP
jgi:hypothetical protein